MPLPDGTPTLDDLTSGDPTGAILGMPPPAPSSPAAALPANPVMPPSPVPPSPEELGRTAPSVIPSALPMSRWALTKPPEQAPAISGLNPSASAPSFLATSQAAASGVPGAAQPLTKLGKLLTILQGAGMGAAVGSTQPTFGRGLMAANQFRDQQQMQQMQLAQVRQNMQMVPTAYGPLPMSIARMLLPKEIQGQTARDVANIAATSRENVADTRMDASRMLAQSRENIAKFNAASREKIAGAQGIEITPDMAEKYHIPPEFIGTKGKLTEIAASQRASVFENLPLQTAAGPIIVNRRTGTARPVTGPAGQTYMPPALASPKEVGDLNNPGQTIIVPGYQSYGQPGTQSASVQVPRQIIKTEVPSKAGDLRLAFGTAIAHADLLETAVRALHNDDPQTLNRIENRFNAEFGNSGPITGAAIADAYSREVQKGLSGNHITQGDVAKIGSTLDVNSQTQQQSLDVINAYRALFGSKMQQLDKQQQVAAEKAQPKKGGGPKTPAAAPQSQHPAGLVPF